MQELNNVVVMMFAATFDYLLLCFYAYHRSTVAKYYNRWKFYVDCFEFSQTLHNYMDKFCLCKVMCAVKHIKVVYSSKNIAV